MNKSTALRLSEKDYEKLEMLKKAYSISNTSELIRTLINNDYTTLMKYEGLYKLSDKQIINVGLYNNSITKRIWKEV